MHMIWASSVQEGFRGHDTHLSFFFSVVYIFKVKKLHVKKRGDITVRKGHRIHLLKT
jgi:hypothetical protein